MSFLRARLSLKSERDNVIELCVCVCVCVCHANHSDVL